MIRNLFFDRDGIVNKLVSRDGGMYSPMTPDDFIIRDEFVRFYMTIHKKGFRLFVISNQPEIARGRLSVITLREMTDTMLRQFEFDEVTYCTHDDSDNCDCRKPKPGMIQKLISKYGLVRDECLIVGDSWKDMEAGRAAGIRTAFLESSYNKDSTVKCDFRIGKLEDLNKKEILGG